jgi:hypothetical protein
MPRTRQPTGSIPILPPGSLMYGTMTSGIPETTGQRLTRHETAHVVTAAQTIPSARDQMIVLDSTIRIKRPPGPGTGCDVEIQDVVQGFWWAENWQAILPAR